MFSRLNKISRIKRPYYHSKTVATASDDIDSKLTITDKCVQQILKVTRGTNNFLRLSVEGGGCSGFQYKFELGSSIHNDDEMFEKNGAKIVVDKISFDYIKGATIDYQEELIRSSFKIVNNPLAEKGCSCGASFAIRMD